MLDVTIVTYCAVGEEAKWRPDLQVNVVTFFIFVQFMIKQLLDSVLSSRSQYELSASADNSYLDLDYSAYHKIRI